MDGRYRLAEVIGTGGMATVHRAIDTKLERTVAVKLLRREAIADSDIAMRFRREALAATVLRHPNIVACLETGTDDGQPFLVMELIEGEDLAARLRRVGRLAPAETARIGLDVARALGVAHVRGIVHRDVKPGNILLARDGRAMVTDFGIARLAADAEGAVPGTTLGSVHYFSPEQATGATTTPASDVYSLGLVLYESLTASARGAARRPRRSRRRGSAARRRRRGTSARRSPPRSTRSSIRRSLDPDPDRRYPNGSAMAAALEPLVGRPGPDQPDGRVRQRAAWQPAQQPQPAAAAAAPAPAAARARATAPAGTAGAPVAASPAGRPVHSPRLACHRRTARRACSSWRRSSPAACSSPLSPDRTDPGNVALRQPRPRRPSPKPTARPTPAPTADPDTCLGQATTKAPKPTAKPAAVTGANLCEPFFGIACGLDKGTYAPATFKPAIAVHPR